MAKMDERAEMIGSSILAQAEQESKELIRKANEIRENEIKSFEEQLIADMFKDVQQKTTNLRVETVRAISNEQVKAHRELLNRRGELAAMTLAAVRTRLFEYVKTPEYSAAIKAELESIAKDYDHSASAVSLREADMGLAEDVKAILPGCTVEADPGIKGGGWKLLNTTAGILIDETLDTRLIDEKPWFLLNSGLRID